MSLRARDNYKTVEPETGDGRKLHGMSQEQTLLPEPVNVRKTTIQKRASNTGMATRDWGRKERIQKQVPNTDIATQDWG